MPAPFGFSVGDFIAVLSLIFQLQEAFRDGCGAPEQYRTVLEAIRNYEHTILTCKNLANEWVPALTASSSPATSAGDQALINGICHLLKASKDALEAFLKENRKFTDEFIKARVSHSMAAQWKRVRWVFKRQDVESLELRVRKFVESLQFFTLAMAMRIAIRPDKGSEKMMEILKAAETGVVQIHQLLVYLQKDIKEMIQIVQHDLPNMLGYPWSTGGFRAQDKPITLHDALGRTVQLPFLFCTSQRVLFDGLPGYNEIRANDYTLVRDKDGTRIKDQNWEDRLNGGDSITMTIILRRVLPRRMIYHSYTCGRCLLQDISIDVTQCPRCFRDSHVLDVEEIIPLPPQPAPFPSANMTAQVDEAGSESTEHQKRNLQPADSKHLQRVTMVREYWKSSWSMTEFAERESWKKFEPTPLHIAIASGDLGQLEKILRCGSNLGAVDFLEQKDYYYEEYSSIGGWTPLHYAARGGRCDMILALIEAGADVNCGAGNNARIENYKPSISDTPLESSVLGGHFNAFQLLLDHGAILHKSHDMVQTAAEGGNLDIVNRLLEAGCDLNDEVAPFTYGFTALQSASKMGHLSIVKRLISLGADVNAPPSDVRGFTALQAACYGNHELVANFLLQRGANVDAKPSPSGWTALEAAAKNGNVNLLRKLRSHKSYSDSTKVQGSDHNERFRYAVSHGNDELVEYLIKRGADVNNFRDKLSTETPLQTASVWNQLKIVRILLRQGADVNPLRAKSSRVYSRLKCYIHPEVIEELLNAGANHELFNRYILLGAINHGQEGIVKKLILAGVDVNRVSRVGHHSGDTSRISPLSLAFHFESDKIAKVLKDAGGEEFNEDEEMNDTDESDCPYEIFEESGEPWETDEEDDM